MGQHLKSLLGDHEPCRGFRTDLVVLLSSVQLLSRVRLFAAPWTAAHQASLSITNSQSLLKLMSIESVIPSNHLILCHPLLLLPSIFPSIRVFSNESALRTRGVRPRLEGKPRTLLSLQVLTGISWSQLRGLKRVKPPEESGERTRFCSP